MLVPPEGRRSSHSCVCTPGTESLSPRRLIPEVADSGHEVDGPDYRLHRPGNAVTGFLIAAQVCPDATEM